MRVLVIGGAGFIGSHLVDRLLAEHHAVDVVDDLSTGSLANLASARAMGAQLKIHHLDACALEFPALVAMREPEVVFHLGWSPPGRTDATVLSRAVHSMLATLEAARANSIAKVVTTLPAGLLYGEVAMRELPVKEGRPWSPVGAEGVIAQTVVELLSVYRSQHDVEFSALAVSSVYGSRQRSDGGVVAAFAAAIQSGEPAVIHGDGRQSRDFVFIDDVVDALVRSASKGSGLVVNIGTGVMSSIRDLWIAMAGVDAAMPGKAVSRPHDLTRVSLSPTRARIHLGWAPWTDLDEGLRSLSRHR